jgi:hypothetical protein
MVALWHPGSGTLYAADAIVGTGPKDQPLQIPITVDFPSLAANSCDRLSKLPVRNLLLAHGGSFEIKDQPKKVEEVEVGDDLCDRTKSSVVVSVSHQFFSGNGRSTESKPMRSLDYSKQFSQRLQERGTKLRSGDFQFNRKGWKGIAFRLLCYPIRWANEYRRVGALLANKQK